MIDALRPASFTGAGRLTIFIHFCSVRLIPFEIDCFYSVWTRIYKISHPNYWSAVAGALFIMIDWFYSYGIFGTFWYTYIIFRFRMLCIVLPLFGASSLNNNLGLTPIRGGGFAMSNSVGLSWRIDCLFVWSIHIPSSKCSPHRRILL